MIIENSPFHISKNKVSHVKENTGLKNQQLLSDKKVNEPGKDDFSFWDWFRGLVNPFQNLPIISGIYSSINSEDSKSDRDLVQNSLGGFMYGGPIGAIAGFGNWVFNKIFDKTPSELALDATGISNLWKDDKKNESQIAEITDDIIEVAKQRRRERLAQQEQEAQRKLNKANYGGFINCNNRGIKDVQTSWRPLYPQQKDEYDLAMEEAQENKKGIY